MPEYRRRLPHFHPDNAWLFLTWRLYASMPAKKSYLVYPTAGQEFAANDRLLDKSATGPRWLAIDQIADLIAASIVKGAAERNFYNLEAWVVMPNHVHMLIQPNSPGRNPDEMAQRLHSPQGQPNSESHRQAILATGNLGPLSPPRVTNRPNSPLHRTEPGVSRFSKSSRKLAMVQRRAGEAPTLPKPPEYISLQSSQLP